MVRLGPNGATPLFLMKPLSLFAITAVVLSSGLWAEEPFRQLPEVQEAVDNKRAPAIAVRDLASQVAFYRDILGTSPPSPP